MANSPKAFDGHGLAGSHAFSIGNIGQVNSRVGGALRRAGKNRSRKGDFENQAKLMQYQANLRDWHNTQAPGHAAAMMTAQREAGSYHDDEGNVLGNISGSWKGAEGTAGSIGGWKNAKRAKAEETEDNPNGQGQQMKQFAGPRKMFLGVYKEDGDAKDKEYPLAKIPTLTSENSTTDDNGRISNVYYSARYRAGRGKFQSNVENRDAYQNQQDVQSQQADDSHNQGQQMRGIF